MARATEQQWGYSSFLSEARFSRSREAHIAAFNVQPGDLLDEAGNLASSALPGPPTGNSPRWIALAPTPPDRVGMIAVLARKAEVNDGFIRYRTLNRTEVNRILALYNIIVRPGVMFTTLSAGLAYDPVTGEPLPPPEGEGQAALLPAVRDAAEVSGPAALLAHGWAVMLHFRAFVIGFAVRWGRR